MTKTLCRGALVRSKLTPLYCAHQPTVDRQQSEELAVSSGLCNISVLIRTDRFVL